MTQALAGRDNEAPQTASKRRQNYDRWKKMMRRCYSARYSGYKRYGARGIKVCDRWHDFGNFNADIGTPPPGMTLDRIDNNGNYEPSNCRWATQLEQIHNSRRSHIVEIDGVKNSTRGWARHFGVSQSTLSYLIRRGMSLLEAINSIKQRSSSEAHS